MALHQRIFLALILGASAGLLFFVAAPLFPFLRLLGPYLAAPVGQAFLRLLFMMVLPLIATALISSTYSMARQKDALSVVGRATLLAVTLAFCAALLSVFLVNTLRPGEGLDLKKIEQMPSTTPNATPSSTTSPGAILACKGQDWVRGIVEVIPLNPFDAFANAHDPAKGGSILSIILFSILIGITLSHCSEERSRPLIDLVESILELSRTYISRLMEFAPFAVAALIFQNTLEFGPHLFSLLFWYMLCVLLGLLLQVLIVYGAALRLMTSFTLREFLSRSKLVIMTAFSTSSSNATLPTTIEVAQKNFYLPKPIASFVLTLGASANQNGSALYEGITVLFLAQLYQVELSALQQLLVLIMTLVASLGTAGVPGGTLPLMMSMCASLNIPSEGLLLILGVERLLDMSRTVVNILGDLVIAISLPKREEPPLQ